MSDPPDSPPLPRRPIALPRRPIPLLPGVLREAPNPVPRSAEAVRVLSAGNTLLSLPGSFVRSLVSTRAWAFICAFGLAIMGLANIYRADETWKAISVLERLAPEKLTTAERRMERAVAVVQFALGAALLFVVPRLFRYASAIARLREARRMAELENALRHQRAVWRVFGAAGVLWLISFIGGLVYLVSSLRELAELRESAGDAYEIEMTE